MEALEPEVMYSGAFGAGKSLIGCEKGLMLSLYYPNNRGAIMRKAFNHLQNSTMETFFEEVCPPEYIKSYNKQRQIVELFNGSRIYFLGFDQKQQDAIKIGSMQFGWAFVDEVVEINLSEWLMLAGRLRWKKVPFYQLFAATNPGPPSHWLYRRFFLQSSPNRKVVESNTLQNTHLPEAYINRLMEFSGRDYERFVEGKWIGYEGLVYNCFDPKEHMVDPFPIPESWEVWRTVDFGYTNPLVCQWWARRPVDSYSDPKPRPWYRFKELYHSEMLVEDAAKLINRESRGMRILGTMGDWDAEDRATMERYGVPVSLARKEITPGIQHCYSELAAGNLLFFKDANLIFDSNLAEKGFPTSTEEEFGVYMYNPKMTQLRGLKELPLDRHNHGMDSMRYLHYTHRQSHSPEARPLTGHKSNMWGSFGRFSDLRESPKYHAFR